MRLRFKIVLPTLLILSLIGFVGDSANSSLTVKYYKETEWVKTTNLTEKDSECFFYNFNLNVAAESVIVHTWSDDYEVHFNEKVRVKLISQIKTCRMRDSINLLVNKSHTPRKSIEDYPLTDL